MRAQAFGLVIKVWTEIKEAEDDVRALYGFLDFSIRFD
jgi:hypothetical protein